MKAALAAVAAMMALSGCANLASVFRDRTMIREGTQTRSNVVTVDSTQRSIVSTLRHGDASDQTIALVCAEPPPDVMSSLNSSVAGTLSASTTTPAQREAALKIAGSLATAVAAIKRSQTVNLLALSMFRTCERYMNGAIGPQEASAQALRDQRAMVTVLAIEQLTSLGSGEFGAAIGEGATTSEQANLGDILAKAKSGADAAKSRLDAATKKYSGELAAAPPAATANGKTPTCADLGPDQQAACTADEKAVADAKAQNDAEQAYYQTQMKLADLGGGAATSATGGKAVPAQRTGGQPLSDHAVDTIAGAVLRLAQLGVQEDTFSIICERRRQAPQNGESQASFEARLTAEHDQDRMCLAARDYLNDTRGVSTGAGQATASLLGTTEFTSALPVSSPPEGGFPSVGGVTPDLYIQVADADQTRLAKAINAGVVNAGPPLSALRRHDSETMGAKWVPKETQVRYYHSEDKKYAAALSRLIGVANGGKPPKCVIPPLKSSPRLGLVELWLSADASLDPNSLAQGNLGGPPGLGCN